MSVILVAATKQQPWLVLHDTDMSHGRNLPCEMLITAERALAGSLRDAL